MGSCPKRQILLYHFSNCQLDFNSSVTEAVSNFGGSEEERAEGKSRLAEVCAELGRLVLV